MVKRTVKTKRQRLASERQNAAASRRSWDLFWEERRCWPSHRVDPVCWGIWGSAGDLLGIYSARWLPPLAQKAGASQRQLGPTEKERRSS